MRILPRRQPITGESDLTPNSRVVDAFGVELGTLLRAEPGKILLGSGANQPAIWLRREAVMRVEGGCLVLSCARNRIGQFAIPARPAAQQERLWPYGQAWPGR